MPASSYNRLSCLEGPDQKPSEPRASGWRRGTVILGLALLALVTPSRAHAYIDPGSGSYLFQLLIAGALGTLYGLKHYWKKIRSFLGSIFKRRS